MPDREKSTAPPPSPPTPPARPAVSPILRESAIALFQLDGQEAALRQLGDLVYSLALEGRGRYLMPKGATGDSILRTDVLGAAGDLRQAADQLRESAQSLAEAGSEDREVMRAALAIADAAAEVAPIADALDAALVRFLGSEVPQ